MFARVQELYDNRDKLGLDPESAYLLERYYKDFVRAGAKLSDSDKEKLKKINAELATLQTEFEQNVLKEKNASSIVVDKKEDLAGLSDSQMATVTNAAKAEHKDGKFVIQLQNTTGQPLLGSLQNRPLRERIMSTSLARNSHGGEFDTRNVVLRTAQLRAEKAKLLGYDNWAAYQLEDQTAQNVSTVNKLLADLAPPAVAQCESEAAEQQKIVDQENGGFQIGAADWDFYSEKVRKAKYDFDESQLRPYYELNHVLLDGVFFAANKLYGLTFKERHDLPVYQPDVRVFDVFDRDGKQLAIFIGDYYARPSKRGGAWMNSYVHAKRTVRHKAGGGEPSQHSETAGGRADSAHPRRSPHRLSRIRPRAPRNVFECEISAIQRHQCAARFRRISVAGERDVGELAGGSEELREALPRPANRFRRRCSTKSRPPTNSIRVTRPPNTSLRRCSIKRGIS